MQSPQVMSVIVATDFSPCAQTAVLLGATLARRRGVALCLVHAIEPLPIDYPAVPVGATTWESEWLAAAEQAIQRDAARLRDSGLAVTTRVLFGFPASVILAAARELAADLIVVGTHGRKGAAHLFLGSVAEGVVRASPCPVLVTRELVPDLERWAKGPAPLRLVAATDGSAASRAAFSWVGRFAATHPCDLSLVRVYWPPEEALHYGLDDPWGGPRRDPELHRLLERDLQRDARALIGVVPERLRYRVASRDAAEMLAEDAQALGVDAVVIGIPRRRSGRWAVLTPSAVLRASPLPVFCVPETGETLATAVPTVRSILVATDLSEASNSAILPAYGLLRAGGGRIELCTAHVVGALGGGDETAPHPPLTEGGRSALEAALRRLIPPEARALGISTGVSVLEGRDVVEAILAAAERLGVDLIALASHGRSGARRALLGSVAEAITRRSSRPVVLVRSSSGAPPAVTAATS